MWMIDNQFGRRDVPTFVKIELVLKFEDFEKEVAQERMKSGKADPMQHVAQGSVRDRLGKKIGVSGEQVRRVKRILEFCDADEIEDLRCGRKTISEAFLNLKQKLNPPKNEEDHPEETKTTLDGKLYIKDRFYDITFRQFGRTKGSFDALEDNILRYGLDKPILVWGDIIIDGHSRYKICCKNEIPYTTRKIEFNNDLEAERFIVKTIERESLGRRTNNFEILNTLVKLSNLENNRDEDLPLEEEDLRKVHETAKDFEIAEDYAVKCLTIIQNGNKEVIEMCRRAKETDGAVESFYEELLTSNHS
jgi:hypothetical protein